MTDKNIQVTGKGMGNNGPIKLEVIIDEGKIIEINVQENSETEAMAKPVFEELRNTILSKQTIEVDGVSGATITSQGYLDAVKDAIDKADVTLDSINATEEADSRKKEEQTMKTDILVVGAGGAGLTAAIAAYENGADVIVLEKLAVIGGSTGLSGGGIAATGTNYQKEKGIEDKKEDWLNTWKERQATTQPDAMYPDYDVLEKLMDEFVKTTDWLEADVGHKYRNVYGLGVDPTPRIHDPKEVGDGLIMGQALIYNLVQYLEKADIPILTQTKGLEFIFDDQGEIAGMKAESADQLLTIEAKKVILASGGFAKNEEMLAKYIPEFAGSSKLSAATVGATGDGINLALEQGAKMYEESWVNGLGIVDFVAPSAIGNLAFNFANVYVNEQGERFFNEANHYSIVTNFVAAQERPYLILDSNEANAGYIENIHAKMDTTEVFKANTLAELAQAIDVPTEKLEQTIANYNAGDSEFGKDTEFLLPIEAGPFYAVKVYPMTMGTFSGVKTDEHFNVLRQDGSTIPNLYAVGEVANKLIYNQVYMSGSAVQFALTSGRLSGTHAANNL